MKMNLGELGQPDGAKFLGILCLPLKRKKQLMMSAYPPFHCIYNCLFTPKISSPYVVRKLSALSSITAVLNCRNR